MKFLFSLDERLFFFINHTLANPIFDTLMPFITEFDNWKIPIILISIFLIIKGGKRGRVAVVLLIPVLILTDQIAAFVIKPWAGRIRPCHVLDNVRLLVSCGGKFAFPSNHAANIAGFAMTFGLIFKRQWVVFLIIALIVGFSRPYVGVHYPGDVLFGYLLGICIASAIFFSYRLIAQWVKFLNFSNYS